MLFDFDKFADIAASVFPGGSYTLDEVLGVFTLLLFATSKSWIFYEGGENK